MSMVGSIIRRGLQDPGTETNANGNRIETSHSGIELHGQGQDTGEPDTGQIPGEC